MIKEIANVIIRNEHTDFTDVSLYSSYTADGHPIYVLKDEGVGRIVEEENIFMKKDDLIDILIDEFIAGKDSIELYVSDDLIKEVIDELEFLLVPEEEYEDDDEDRKYDEYIDNKLTTK